MDASCASTLHIGGGRVSLGLQAGEKRREVSAPREAAFFDSHGRRIREARISLTDRCNFRCVYCLDPGVQFMDKARLLTADDVLRLVGVLVDHGVEKIRLTGGEPTLRPDLDEIIGRIASLGVSDLAMTTNGSYSDPNAPRRWASLGLSRVTVSLDSLRQDRLSSMTRSGVPLDAIVSFTKRCRDAGLGPVKVNVVVVRGGNDDEVGDFIQFGRRHRVFVRFIEYMPLDSGRAWSREKLVPAAEILDSIRSDASLVAEPSRRQGETSENFVFTDGAAGGVGIIAPVTRPFCGACGRLRITADAKVRPCLFSHVEWDLLPMLRNGDSNAALAGRIADATWSKQSGHGIANPGFVQPTRSMSSIGG